MIDLDFIEKALKVKPFLNGHPEINSISNFTIDSRSVSGGMFSRYECFVSIEGSNFNGHDFIKDCYDKGIRCFIIQNRYKNKLRDIVREGFIFPVDDTIEALGKLAFRYKNNLFASVIAITGSSGKTTTRELAVKILSQKYNVHTAKKNFNNEIGLPLTILETPMRTHIIILEIGMNHKGELKRLSRIAQPLAGIITNIGYAHIGFFDSLDSIADAKAELFSGMKSNSYAFLNRDGSYYNYLKKLAPGKVIDFGYSDLNILEDRVLDGYRLSYQGREFEFSLTGLHNLSNLSAAFKIGEFYRVDTDDILNAAEGFVPVSGRCEIIRKDITIINDCYNANPSSMQAGLELLSKVKGRRIAVLSDMLELGKLSVNLHNMIGDDIGKNNYADIVMAYGNESRNLISRLKSYGINCGWFPSIEELTAAVLNTVKKGDTILVKASHGMKLDIVVKALSERY